MKEKIKRHVGIIILLAMGAFLLLAEKIFFITTPPEAKFAGGLALIWALVLIRTSLGKEGKMRKIEETSFYQKIKEDPSIKKEE